MPTLDWCAAGRLALASRVTIPREEAERGVDLRGGFVAAEEVADFGPCQSCRGAPQRFKNRISNIVAQALTEHPMRGTLA